MPSEMRVCGSHGEFKAHQFRSHWSGCPKCLEEIDLRHRQAEIERFEMERKDRMWKSILGRSAIPERFSEKTLENYFPKTEGAESALQICREYAANFEGILKIGRSLILCGGVGTGKTHLAVGIANAIMKEGKQPVFSSVSKAIRKIKETYARDSVKTEDEAIQDFIKPDLLILDEVGVQFGSETEKMYLFEIINGRYELLKPTILISNLGRAELEKFIGTRVIDRLREGGGRMVVFDWGSYRREA
ncbi:ATP-binding protein [Undibacterium sp. MH2W]|uniref:ATP-binding protein n=1 Tax=Undibacterium sp. MH2W TaxID=3413044 RepID=UPI003BF0BA6E